MQCVANPQLHVSSRVGVTDPILQTFPGWVPGIQKRRLPHLAGSLGRSCNDGSDSELSRHKVSVEHYTYPGLGSACQCGGSSSRSIGRFCNALWPVHLAAPEKGGHAAGLSAQACLVQIARAHCEERTLLRHAPSTGVGLLRSTTGLLRTGYVAMQRTRQYFKVRNMQA